MNVLIPFESQVTQDSSALDCFYSFFCLSVICIIEHKLYHKTIHADTCRGLAQNAEILVRSKQKYDISDKLSIEMVFCTFLNCF